MIAPCFAVMDFFSLFSSNYCITGYFLMSCISLMCPVLAWLFNKAVAFLWLSVMLSMSSVSSFLRSVLFAGQAEQRLL